MNTTPNRRLVRWIQVALAAAAIACAGSFDVGLAAAAPPVTPTPIPAPEPAPAAPAQKPKPTPLPTTCAWLTEHGEYEFYLPGEVTSNGYYICGEDGRWHLLQSQ